ncbi:MAG: radical SAM family heme chaperone HemW [Gaiellaceae bacterium]
MSGVRHLYVHLPFCAYRCGYCDFVTLVGRRGDHGSYAAAVLSELELERPLLATDLETIFLGGGTPTYLEGDALAGLLAALPRASELTIEANPETVTGELADGLRRAGVTRVSLGAQSFQPHLLEVLERRATPDVVRRAFYHLRDANFDNISLDLIYGIPGQSTADLERDLEAALALRPEHLSLYELEAKPGTRFTHAHGEELGRQAEAMEDYLERVVDVLRSAGYRWYETANFCLQASRAGGRDLRSLHNLAYWRGRDYLGLGIGAVSTVGDRRWRNAPRLRPYLEALAESRRPPREVELLPSDVRLRERAMLGLRLDQPLVLASVDGALDGQALRRLERLALVERHGEDGGSTIELTERGRFVGDAVAAELIA